MEIANLCKQHKPEPRYEVVELAKKFDYLVLYLPVGHPELNPIELVWAYMKPYVAKHNVNFSFAEVERLAHAALDKFDEK